jgi:hypothetical protein
MKKKFEFNYFPDINKKRLDYHNNFTKISNELDKWSKLESILQKNRSDNYFSNDTISTLNLGSLKSMEWEDDINKNIPTLNNEINYDLSLNKNNQKNDLNLKSLEKLISPIDNEFETFVQNKINELEKLKNRNQKLINYNPNISNIIKKDVNIKNINNKIFLRKEKNEGKSIVREKNEAILTFNKNGIENNDEFEKVKGKSFLDDYICNDNINNHNNVYNKNNYENNVGYRNKIRLNNLLSKIKTDKKETELVNKPNKFKIFDDSDDNSNLNKIQRKYYEQLRVKDKKSNSSNYSNDYFSTILYDLNQSK